jgi:hypothetical protein
MNLKLTTLVGSILLSGCASSFMVGSQPHNGVPAGAVVQYRAPVCTLVANGSVVPGPVDQSYYLDEEGFPILYELDQRGRGRRSRTTGVTRRAITSSPTSRPTMTGNT